MRLFFGWSQQNSAAYYFHRLEILENILNEKENLIIVPQEPIERAFHKNDEIACWSERHLSCKNLIYRMVYRLLRRCRSKFF